MNLAALRERLSEESFRADTYSLDGVPPPFEGFILSHNGGAWQIEYCERGIRREMACLHSEAAACDEMYRLLAKYCSPEQGD